MSRGRMQLSVSSKKMGDELAVDPPERGATTGTIPRFAGNCPKPDLTVVCSYLLFHFPSQLDLSVV